MPIKNKNPEQARFQGTFSDFVRPFAEKLAAKANETDPSDEAVEAFKDALNEWFKQILGKLGYDVVDALSSVQESAISLQRALTRFKPSALAKPDLHEHNVLRTGEMFLNRYLRNGEPPFTDIDSLCGVLSKLIEGIRGETRPKRQQGKPFGIKKYPGLNTLVFKLGICAETHLVAPFTVHINKMEDLRIAAGSLIEALDSLRDFLLDSQMAELASELPTRDEHPTYVSSYQRALSAAREEVQRFFRRDACCYPEILALSIID